MDRGERWTLIELGPLDSDRRSQLEGDEVDPWGTRGNELIWRPKEHHVALEGPDRRLVAAAGWLVTKVEIESRVIPVVGIGGVIVAAPYRGQGLGGRVIAEVLDRAERERRQITMLFCQRDRVSLYRRRGFIRIEHPVLVEQPDGQVEVPLETMWRPSCAGAALAAGRVSVHSLPF